MHALISTHTHIRAHAHLSACAHTHTYAYMQVHVHMHIDTCIHTHMHTHTHTHTHTWMHYMDANKTAGEETRWQLHKNAACNPEQVLAATPHKTPTVRPPAPYHENYSS